MASFPRFVLIQFLLCRNCFFLKLSLPYLISFINISIKTRFYNIMFIVKIISFPLREIRCIRDCAIIIRRGEGGSKTRGAQCKFTMCVQLIKLQRRLFGYPKTFTVKGSPTSARNDATLRWNSAKNCYQEPREVHLLSGSRFRDSVLNFENQGSARKEPRTDPDTNANGDDVNYF